jgi:hypothetical protein
MNLSEPLQRSLSIESPLVIHEENAVPHSRHCDLLLLLREGDWRLLAEESVC